MLKTPSLSCFLSLLSSIEQQQVFYLQKWLIKRIHELGLSAGKQIAYNFNYIDLDVNYPRLRYFGAGPSPKKKICWSGFRPHIAWDVDSGTLLVAEFRKASARGATTFQRFTEEFLKPVFSELFEEVYINSEYTGKQVWNYILDDDKGMGAQLTGCLKQNAFVKKHRDQFLLDNKENQDFWKNWDENHVYSSKSFTLTWSCENQKTKNRKEFNLNCVVKKNIRNGKYRCFGSSHIQKPEFILKNYSKRWSIENGIKDLIYT